MADAQHIGVQIWPPPLSVYDDTKPPSRTRICFRWLNTTSVLVVACLLLSLWYAGFDLYLAIAGIMHFTHYTYSALLMFSVFIWALTLSLLVKRGSLTLVLLLGFPLINGTTFFVTIAIVIIIALNADVLNGGDHAPEQVHTADFLLHPMQTLTLVTLLYIGLLNDVRSIVRGRWLEWRWPMRGLYTAYFFLIPLLPLMIYGAVEDPRERYSIALPTWLIWLLAIALMLAVQAVSFLAVLVDDRSRLSMDKLHAADGVSGAAVEVRREQQQPLVVRVPSAGLGEELYL